MRPVGPGLVGKGRIGDDVVVGAELFAVQELGFHERALTAGLDACLVTKLDRLGRNTLDMITIVEQLHKKGVSVTFLDDNLSTKGDIVYMLITILSAVAQAERSRILERTNEGREAAMDKGIQFGRKPHKSSDKALKMIKAGTAAKEVIASTGISRPTYFRLKKTAKS